MADLYFLPSGVPPPSRSFDYSPSTQHVKAGNFSVPPPSRSFDYSPSTQHVKAAPVVNLAVVLGAPGGLALLQAGAAAGQEVTLTRATETESARALGITRVVALTRATETDAARTISAQRVVDLARVTETGTARTLTYARGVTLDRATETAVARALSIARGITLGRATETGNARAVSVAHLADIIRATEADSARTLTVAQALIADLIRAAETDSARDVFAQRSYGQRAFQVVLHEEETGESQTLYLSMTAVPFVRGYEAVAYAHGPEDIEYEVEVEAIAA